jgi:KaiC/GvpD/RAD55 family RecA-like ATPase/tetratricopeptide (TPR) repeat protein
MQSGSGVDLFSGFNEDEVSEVLRRCAGCSRFVLIGPPRSGKTFFKENYLEDRLGAGVAVDEYTLGISTTAKTEREEAGGESGILGKVMKYLEGMIPLIKRLRDSAEVDEELRKLLGDRAPKLVVEGARRSIGDSPHRAYYIPWKCVEESNACTSNKDVSRALELIQKVFDDKKIRIRWFKAEYVPPGLVEEVIDLIRLKGEEGAREELKDWVEAYSKAIDILRRFLGLGDDLFMWDELATSFLSNFVNNSASYVIGGLTTALMDAASLALISVLTYMAFEREGEGYLKGIIELKRSLERLRRSDGEFNELGKLLVYRVAYAMGMSYDEAKKALIDITGLSIDELKRRVNEIEGRIKELEKKIELFRQEVPAGIVTADVNEFAKGRTYPNIKVENGELRIRVEDGYHSIVRAGKFNELVNEVKGRLVDDGVVVVVGPKGIGKSTLATTVIWELFMNGDIGLVARVDRLDSKNYSEFATFVENYGEYFGRLLILYDPVSTKAYEKVDVDVETPIQASIEWTVKNLIDVINSISSEATKPLTLIVLPSDIYNALNSDMRAKLESHSFDAAQKLINTEFLAELIREYTMTRSKPSGCALSNNVLSKLVDELTKFDSGHALIARLIGRELARNNCDVDEVKELINKAKSKAETFIILHINGLFKVNKTSDTTKEAIVKVFALRRPFVSWVRPGDPILTPGVVKLMGVSGLSGWLAIRQHDLIEGAIKKLLDCIVSENEECKDLSDALEPWVPRTVGLLREVSEKVKDVDSAIEYFASNYGKRLTEDGLSRFSNCWKRAALIIGYALAGQSIVSRPEDVPDDVVESLGDVLKRCGVDDYLLVGNEIPLLIMGLAFAYTRALTEAFIDKYDEAAAEVRRVLNIIKSSSDIFDELLYGLGLASIIANAAESSRDVKPSDADAAIHIASLAIKRVVVSLEPTMPILRALEPLRDKAPQRYLEVLVSALDHASTWDLSWNTTMNILNELLRALEPLRDKAPQRYLEVLAPVLYIVSTRNIPTLSWNTTMNILNEFDYILNKYGDGVKGHARPLVYVIDALINLFYKRLFNERPENLGHCDNYMFEHMDASFRKDLEHIVSRVAGLLNEINKLNPSLGIIAWAHALQPALDNKCIRMLMESMLGIDVVNKAKEVSGELSRLRVKVQELIRDEDFMGFVESGLEGTGEKVVRRKILEETSTLKHALARYRLINGELNEAEELFNEVAEEGREICEYDYLNNRGWALRVEAIKGSLAGDDLVNLVDKLRQLYEETKKYDAFLSNEILGGYLVSLALMGGDEGIRRIEELLGERWQVLNHSELDFLTRLTLNALLSPRGELSSELKDRLVVKPGELIATLDLDIDINSLPALKATYGTMKPGDEIRLCDELIDYSLTREFCVRHVSRAYSEELDQQAEGNLRQALINDFQRWISKGEVLDLLKKLGLNAELLNDELKRLIHELSGKSLRSVFSISHCFEYEQLHCSLYHLTYMLYALINGNEKLAKAHALMGAMIYTEKLPARLFLEAYRTCCDPNNEEFRRAVAKLFFYHV